MAASPTPDLGYPVYDADNHLYEPEDAFTRHLERRFRRDIQYVQVRGRTKLAICGQISDYIPNPTFEVVARPGASEAWFRGKNEGVSLRELYGEPEKCRPAYRNPESRLALMNEQGLHATLLHPTLLSAIEERTKHDADLLHALIHSFNEWLLEEWGFVHEDRIFAVPQITLMDVARGVAELEWLLERGARCVGLRPAPVPGYRGGRSPGFPEFDPFWSRVAEAGIPVAMHASDSGYDKYAADWAGGAEFRPFEPDPFRSMVMGDRPICDCMSALIIHGVFERNPGVRVAVIENGSRWVLPLIEKLESTFRRQPWEARSGPRETFQRHISVSPFYEEDLVSLAEGIGVERVIFGSDFPHPEGLANPLDYLKELDGFDDADRRRIMSDNLIGLLDPSGSRALA